MTPGARAGLGRDDLEGHPAEVAPLLLNSVLAVGDRTARVVEVEAYAGGEDAASHAHRGPTARTSVMFGPAGHLYVYRSYGLHWCANVVVGVGGTAAAVLLRAAEPLTGVAAMRRARPAARRTRDLANGPGKLCAALGITGEDAGSDLFDPASRVRLEPGAPPPPDPVVTTRVGISRAVELPWRFAVPGDAHLSRGRPSGG